MMNHNRYANPQTTTIAPHPDELTLEVAGAWASLGIVQGTLIAAGKRQIAQDLLIEFCEISRMIGVNLETVKIAARNINLEIEFMR